MPAPLPISRLFVEGFDRDPPELVPAGAGELAEVLRTGWRWGTAGRGWRTGPRRGRRSRSRRRSRAGRSPSAIRLSTLGLREISSARPVVAAVATLEPPQAARTAPAPARSPAASGEQTVQPLVDRRLGDGVVGEAVVRLHGDQPPAALRSPRSPASPAARAGRGRGRSGSRRRSTSASRPPRE